MANIYALPSLTAWNTTAGGWSNTSGGASNGRVPNSSDTVIFDANSGAARAIPVTSSPQVSTIVCTGAQMTLTGSTVALYGTGAIDLSGFASIAGVSLPALGSSTLKTGNCTLGSFGCTGSLTLSSDLTVTGAFSLSAQSNPTTFNANGYNVTCGNFINNVGTDEVGTSINTVVTLGSGMWTLTGTGVLMAGPVVAANATVKINSPNSSAKSFNGSILTNTTTLWVADTGTGTLTLREQFSIGTFRASKGNLLFGETTSVSTYTAVNWQVAGTSSAYISLTSAGAANGFYSLLASPNTTTPIYLDYCKFNKIGVNGNQPNFYARSWIDAGGMSNINQFVAKPNFTAFF
jgi:hypothetical protein